MARIELRDCTIYIRDGLSGTAKLTANGSVNGTTLNINTVNTNASVNTTIPRGARLRLPGETVPVDHVVQSANTVNGVTDWVTISPALGAGSYNSGNTENVVTINTCQLEVKVGEGNLTWSEKKEYEYLLDRGDLDTVKEGNEVPVEMSMEFVYEHVTTGTSEDISPGDAVKRLGAASEWVTSSSDQCEPYAVDVVVVHESPCASAGIQDETLTFQDFRFESLDYDLGAATVSVSGKCNVSTINAVRS
jgi:hypothetical protein